MVVHPYFQDADDAHLSPFKPPVLASGDWVIGGFKDKPVGLVEVQRQVPLPVPNKFMAMTRDVAHVREGDCSIEVI